MANRFNRISTNVGDFLVVNIPSKGSFLFIVKLVAVSPFIIVIDKKHGEKFDYGKDEFYINEDLTVILQKDILAKINELVYKSTNLKMPLVSNILRF